MPCSLSSSLHDFLNGCRYQAITLKTIILPGFGRLTEFRVADLDLRETRFWTPCLTPGGRGISRQESAADIVGKHWGVTQDLWTLSQLCLIAKRTASF